MWRALGWIMAALLCCVAAPVAARSPRAERIQEARAAYAEAAALSESGQYASAIPKAEHALALATAALGESHLKVSLCLELLGHLHLRQGAPQRAEPLLLRALAMREAVLGAGDPGLGSVLLEVGTLYMKQGLYARAEPLYQRALAISEATLGQHHQTVASLLNNLALLYDHQGMYEQSRPLYYRSLDITEAAFGKNHLFVAAQVTNLASGFMATGMYSAARFNAQRALEIKEAALGEHHPDLAHSLRLLANLYSLEGQYSQAEPLYQRALAIQEAALGPHDPSIASSLNSLGVLYMEQGQYARAAPLLERALALRESALGKHHPLLVTSLANLAMNRRGQQRFNEALPLLERVLASSERRLRLEAPELPAWRLDNLLGQLRLREVQLYSLLREHPDNAAMRRLALSAVLLRKGRSAAELAGTSRILYRSLGTQDRETFQKMRELRARVAALTLEGPDSRSPADYQQRLTALDTQYEALEKELAKRSAPLRALATLPPPNEIVDRVAAALPRDSALVEFIAYEDPLLPSPAGTSDPDPPLPVRYLALVLMPDAAIRMVELGPAEPIDQAASNLRVALARRDADFQGAAQALYRLAFVPVLPLLGASRRVYLSPDGQLGMVPFAALHDGRQFLIDSFDFTYLTSGKDLLPRQGEPRRPRSVVVLADPTFNAPRARLPGTGQEARAIRQLIPRARLILGREATRERLLRLPTPGVLHLATHGFFLEDEPTQVASRAVAKFGALGEDKPRRRLMDPLLRSGLVLASARLPARGSSSTRMPRPDDSLVTASDMVGLDLWGTELVVLSACDTGRGEALLGQGVYGLRHALVVAGAETVVMSLWKVNDDTTRQLMEAYYRNLIAGQGRVAALREAMRALRATQPHPHYWAPFIALGQDAPLSLLAPAATRVSK